MLGNGGGRQSEHRLRDMICNRNSFASKRRCQRPNTCPALFYNANTVKQIFVQVVLSLSLLRNEEYDLATW